MQYKCGYLEGILFDKNRTNWSATGPRPIAYSAWYPAHAETEATLLQYGGNPNEPLFEMGAVAKGVEISNHQHLYPLVLLSHGTGGSAQGMGWLGCRLAEMGYISIGISHHGNTSLEPYVAEGFLCWWERALDFTFLLDNLHQQPVLSTHCNLDKISAVGFSLGGYTVLSLAGAITSLDQFKHWLDKQPDYRGGPKEFPSLDQEIDRLMKTSRPYQDARMRHDADYYDSRIKAFVTLAPAPPVRALTLQSLQSIKSPVLIIAGEADTEAPFEQCAKWLTKQNLDFKLASLGSSVGHYVFLCNCTKYGKAIEPDICIDSDSVNRDDMHTKTAQMINHFLCSTSQGHATDT